MPITCKAILRMDERSSCKFDLIIKNGVIVYKPKREFCGNKFAHVIR